MKSFYILALAVLLVISCSLTENGATMSAAIVKTPPERPQITNQPETIATPTKGPQRCTVATGTAAGRLNMRACAGTNCGVIFVLDEGDRLTVIDAGSWYHVKTEAGAAGFVNSNYCQIGEIRK